MKISKAYLSMSDNGLWQKRRDYEQSLPPFTIIDQKTFIDEETNIWVQFVKYDTKGE